MIDDTYNGCDLDRDQGNRGNDVKAAILKKKKMLTNLSIANDLK